MEDEVVVYEWSARSGAPRDAEIRIRVGEDRAADHGFLTAIFVSTDLSVAISHQTTSLGKRWAHGRVQALGPVDQARLLGWLLDAGTDHQGGGVGMLGYQDQVELLPCPRWVPDERWARRHEEACVGRSDRSWKVSGLFLGHLQNLVVSQHPQARDYGSWRAGWSSGDSASVAWGSSPETLVDRVCEKAMLRPESERASWEAENVRFGRFVFPDGDRVQLLRALGEELPFWRGLDGFRRWAAEVGE